MGIYNMSNEIKMKKKRVLVTGSTGFIGRHLVDELLARNYDVSCLIRPETDPDVLNEKNIELVRADYFDPKSLDIALTGVDYLIHNGAVVNSRDKDLIFRSNVIATKNLMEACYRVNPGIKKILFVSSIAASGPTSEKRALTENDECRPSSIYGKSKYKAEQEVKKFYSRLPIIIIRPTHILGVYQKQVEDILKAVKKRIIPVLGNGDKQTTICFVEDLVRAFILSIESEKIKSTVYFVADEKLYSWMEITEKIREEMGINFVIKIPYPILIFIGFIAELVSDILGRSPLITRKRINSVRSNYWVHDTGKIKKELGFSTEIEFKEGIKKIVSWYRENNII